MISSFFSKTKPVHYILALSFVFILYFGVHLIWQNPEINTLFIIRKIAVVTFLLFSLLALNFIVKRNTLTKTNSFALLFYILLMLVFPETLLDNNAIFCCCFLLLAARRIVSLKSLKSVGVKIFDASFWIVISSFFYDWAILYLLLLYVAIYFYEPKNLRNWLIPLVATATVILISYTVLILFNNTSFLKSHYTFNIQIQKIQSFQMSNSIKFLVYFLITSFCGILGFVKLGKSGTGRIITIRLVTLMFFIGVIVSFLKSESNVFPIMITFFPASVFMTNYIESIKKTRNKELILILALLLPTLIFIWQATML